MGIARQRIALVTHASGGGVWTVTRFLERIILDSRRYDADIIFVATSARDVASTRLLAPRTWRRGPQQGSISLAGMTYPLVGASITEFEFMRYRPRRVLTSLLQQYDLIQIVAGTPAWAAIARPVKRPLCLFTATTIRHERAGVRAATRGWRRLWLDAMTAANARTERGILPHLDAVFAESEYTRRSLNGRLPAQRVHLGLPGIDTAFFTPAPSYARDGFLLAVGRFDDPRKNVRMLFSAYARLRRTNPHAPRLVLAGQTPPSATDWQYAHALGVADFIDLHIGIDETGLRDLYRSAALFVLSSDEEGLGLVILEAMACGLPVISTDCGGPASAIVPRATGLLTPVGDDAALAQAIENLLNDGATRAVMGQAARQRAVERFSYAAAGRVYLDVYDQLLAS